MSSPVHQPTTPPTSTQASILASDDATRPAPRLDWTIQCDFDGTINLRDVTDALLQRFGQPGWEALEAEWEAGRIGSRECMPGQVALMDMSREEFDAEIGAMRIDPGFPAFVAEAERLGIPVQVISDGLDVAIRAILTRHGLGHLPVIANHLEQAAPRQWRLQTPWTDPACAKRSANCKCNRLAAQRETSRRVLFVGDGSSDFCVSGKADFVLAKARLIGHCVDNDIPHAAFTDFVEATALLTATVERFQAEELAQ
ncbi:MtnX-like HAD-IB family phosphatase [Mitsuaria sp. GD03876]|uniref:MtnX-like HAD-IB family phosphatase n=1 Tax=Mitsuaria sp. GD03876 TaxID=2975399 RepID=UPI00244AE369|nr:MtnX-like HAD-IB family phosphatase [Mitsuaria sp. GD03876]MDH0865361.1 MtnX-like HAD-IB family phosphatase [Mitsuaria sp. GD03876]